MKTCRKSRKRPASSAQPPSDTSLISLFPFVLQNTTFWRKQAERALDQSEKLASVGRLSGAVVHEINNPLEGVKNLLYMIASDPG